MMEDRRKYFKPGDIVMDFKGSVWGDTHFEIMHVAGNAYCPLAWVQEIGKPIMIKYGCNLNLSEARLIRADNRPLRNIKLKPLLVMKKKGIIEAVREYMIRINNKEL